MGDSGRYIAGTITVPERRSVIAPVVQEFKRVGIEHKVFVDPEHRGHKWNLSRMLLYLCTHYQDRNAIITMDDILFKNGWLEKCNEVLDNSDYQVVTFFTNRNYTANDVCGIHKADQNWWLYDHFVLFRQGVLCPEWFDGFMDFCRRPDKHKKEKFCDNLVSHYLIVNNYKCGIVRPNFIRLQNAKSTIGNRLVIKDDN